MVLNTGKCRFMLFRVNKNDKFNIMCNEVILKHISHENILGVTIDNKVSFDEHVINICKTTNKKLNQKKIETKSKMNIIAILHNFLLQLWFLNLNVFHHKIH